ncbi:MAG: TolC family protein [Dysgonamonadaceae bacterium]|jgi:outer membrane protein TolC|nr:TolC family protein [Dysgonamonadaceae bacterium]MDD3355546.1 TolC family protein [Dysgonamonadaceae bacterium]MDD3726939.1 TolC family protein [Dysgonamonadaceae bacterium]MDD4245800.1 TolC family protein [Dysgonamonadaceae bacterium]HUI32727.1 TolC family protein [Dysgonamonadaceae bacterium]
MKSRSFLFLVILFLSVIGAKSQIITLNECQDMARENYPAISRFSIIEQSKNYTLANANKAYLPQLSLEAKATYQSDVITIPLDMPGVEIPVPDKDQYQIVAQADQIIWDGGKIAAKKEIVKTGAQLEEKTLETEIYSLRERVNNLYFGILLMQEQLKQQTSLEEELQRNYDKVVSYIENGVANQADLSSVKIEILKANQQRIQMESTHNAYLNMLSVLIGEELSVETGFVRPPVLNETSLVTINRPELEMFSAQKATIDAQTGALKSDIRPKIGAFVQGGYGKPGLNMLQNEFDTFFLGGIKLSWNFGNLYTFKNSVKTNELKKLSIDTQRDTFVYNLDVKISQEQNEIEKYRKTMQDDEEIILLQQEIKDAAEAKVDNGTMTVSDMLKELTALEMAKQAKLLHEIQHISSIYTLKNTTN